MCLTSDCHRSAGERMMTSSQNSVVRWLSRVLPFVIALSLFLLYVLTMPRGLSWDFGGADAGELATGVFLRGLVHSPGYPTYLIFAQPAALIPVPSPAHRLAIFSA